jgi:predicted AAA+ superfamily ATPase
LIDDSLPTQVKDKCVVGEFLGKAEALDQFVKQRYLFVSRQTSGAESNSLGNITQDYVAKLLIGYLGDGWQVIINGSLPGVSHVKDGNGTNFDLVVISPNKKYFGVEISFQVTTNSTIERKARESESIMKTVHSRGHKICYVIDGAGNINIRENAVRIILGHSDCTVAMSEVEIQHLANFFKSNLI